MKILFISDNNKPAFYRFVKYQSDILKDLSLKSTTHASLVKRTLLLHHISNDFNVSIDIIIEDDISKRSYDLFNYVNAKNVKYNDYDVIFLFGWQGLEHYIKLNPVFNGKLLTWLEGDSKVNIVNKLNKKPTHAAWASQNMMDTYKHLFPKTTKHVICPHGSNIIPLETIQEERIDKALYFGRMTDGYSKQVIDTSKYIDVDSYTLWIYKNKKERVGNKLNDIYNFRPGKYEESDLVKAQSIVGDNVIIKPAINVSEHVKELSKYQFGICPATSLTGKQPNNASKFYDYVSLGLPVLTEYFCPEADFITDKIGYVFKHNDLNSIKKGVKKCLELGKDKYAREYILDYGKNQHGYKNRASILYNFIK